VGHYITSGKVYGKSKLEGEKKILENRLNLKLNSPKFKNDLLNGHFQSNIFKLKA